MTVNIFTVLEPFWDGKRYYFSFWRLSLYNSNLLSFRLVSVSRKPRKLFGPVKPCLIYLYLKIEKRICPKPLCMKGTPVHVKNMWIKQLCFSGCEHLPGPSRNGPLASEDKWEVPTRGCRRKGANMYSNITRSTTTKYNKFLYNLLLWLTVRPIIAIKWLHSSAGLSCCCLCACC